MKKLKLFSLIALSSAFILSSCGGSNGGGTKSFVSKTGWKPNDKKGWFFAGKQEKQKGWPGMVLVEGGTFTMGLVKDDVMHDWNNTPHRMQVSSFFMGETEITNYEYREYLTWLKYVFPPSDPDFKEIYSGALPDTLLWENKLSRNDNATNYFRDPGYDFYPVVGVTWTQANNYCDWLTNRANEKALMDKGVIAKNLYLNDSNNIGATAFNMDKFKSNDPEMAAYINKQRLDQKSGLKGVTDRVRSANGSPNSDLVTKFRLPTEVEWEFAALAVEKNREYNNLLGKNPEIENLRGTKGKNSGMFLENFKNGTGDYSGVPGWKNDGAARTADVKDFPSNALGLYGMYGNVAEWCADVYRPIIDAEYSDFNYFRGNVTQKINRNGDGSYKKVEQGTMKFDTLNDGRLVPRNLPGEFEREVIADYSNFRDGDRRSSLEYRTESDSTDPNFSMYNAPKKNFYVDANGKVILEKDVANRTSQVANYIRVVKGGSWQDTAYWLDPGQRRYKDEKQGFGWIGFRVAQDAKSNEKSRTRR
ncbi:gliding motility lipoprotein GldJ [Frigoriflavimonas asaccharolytica]|uniref:Gliding motility-associated lipoprotein GldJ n=1 Tax=Frigoriflavimonas asaccharolytica TaxID=2735899 RepID=A0A8J8K630_9FLAO|nr:gliding motility lipoprotein GldJ [Frigoriflavimonas asaccharolytica]NRS93285.1 gliding motility-associated lipoprotein GldJ [Frigoriflavimonas asaccharolytica]